MEKIIEGVSLVEDAVGRWDASDLAFIERFMIYVDYSEGRTVEITASFQRRDRRKVWPNRDDQFVTVDLQFRYVRDISLNWVGYGPIQVTGFYIDDVSAEGLEDLNFKIGDYEDDRLSFVCRDITVVGVS